MTRGSNDARFTQSRTALGYPKRGQRGRAEGTTNLLQALGTCARTDGRPGLVASRTLVGDTTYAATAGTCGPKRFWASISFAGTY